MMKFDELSPDAQETIIGMIEYCLNHGLCMGMDEGFLDIDNQTKHTFRAEIEQFISDKN